MISLYDQDTHTLFQKIFNTDLRHFMVNWHLGFDLLLFEDYLKYNFDYDKHAENQSMASFVADKFGKPAADFLLKLLTAE